MTPVDLMKCMPWASMQNAMKYAIPLTAAMAQFEINTKLRQCYFIAQIAHETASMSTMTEYASGAAYEGRTDLGNDEPGDGIKYKGHGGLQVTGKTNHFAVADFFSIPRDNIVEWLVSPEGAMRSAGWFWQKHNLNASADADNIQDNTRIINGGLNGLSQRIIRLGEAKHGLGV